ncbi:hypothetical protein Acsp07_12970 [Actinomycetospora sp. NBRC 106378]|nr:hypothetical protein Acsp07_12970 [Actinomycetospora sp. NBRC 106378]
MATVLVLVGGPLLFLTATSQTAPAQAAPADAVNRAVRWAQSQAGSRAYDGLCLKFVYDAYRLGAGTDTRGGMSTNGNTTAVDFWNHFPQFQHRGDANPPRGAFVFWGPTRWNGAGHVALSLGNRQVISSYERTVPGVHTFGLADRAGAYNYLGWMMPPGIAASTPPPPTPPVSNQPVFTVMNTSETPPDGVWFRDNPAASGPRLGGYGVYQNDRVQLRCYGWGESIGRFGNRLWYYSANLTRPNAPGRPNVGWLNAHFVDDRQNANAVVPGVPAC